MVGPEADISVGPDDEERRLAGAQLVGRGERKPRTGTAIVTASHQRDGRFDDRHALPGVPEATELHQLFNRRR